MADTTIQLCGRFVVSLQGRRIENDLPGRQGRLLFAFLVLNRDRPVRRDELVEALWSRELPQAPLDSLGALLSRVRGALGDRYLEGRSNLTLRLPPGADVDVERAMEAVHRAESAASLADWPRAWGAGLCGHLIAQRTLLGEHEAEWLDEWRETMADVDVRSLECYVRACLGLGGAERAGAVRASRLLVKAAPLRESAYELLMSALEAEGNVAEAIAVFEDARRLLDDELGVPPARSLQARYQRLRGAASDA